VRNEKIKDRNDYSISDERIKQYQTVPLEKRFEWLYLGNLLRKAFFKMMEKEPFDTKMSRVENSKGLRG